MTEEPIFELEYSVFTGQEEVCPQYAFYYPEGVEEYLEKGYWFAVADWEGETGEPARFTRKEDLISWIGEELGRFGLNFGEEGFPDSWEAYLRAYPCNPGGDDDEDCHRSGWPNWEGSWSLDPRAVINYIPIAVEEAGFRLEAKIPWVPGRYIALGFTYYEVGNPVDKRYFRVATDEYGQLSFRTENEEDLTLEEAVRETLRAMRKFQEQNWWDEYGQLKYLDSFWVVYNDPWPTGYQKEFEVEEVGVEEAEEEEEY